MEPRPGTDDLTNALWCACHGGQCEAAQCLMALGGDINWAGHDGLTPLEAARPTGAGELADWLRAQGDKAVG
jgi:ankyrin repeat protein